MFVQARMQPEQRQQRQIRGFDQAGDECGQHHHRRRLQRARQAAQRRELLRGTGNLPEHRQGQQSHQQAAGTDGKRLHPLGARKFQENRPRHDSYRKDRAVDSMTAPRDSVPLALFIQISLAIHTKPSAHPAMNRSAIHTATPARRA